MPPSEMSRAEWTKPALGERGEQVMKIGLGCEVECRRLAP